MKMLARSLCCGALLTMAGCVGPKADSRLVGTYISDSSECLIIAPDTRVFHGTRMNKREDGFLIGYSAQLSSSPPGTLFINSPDTSAFLGTSLQFNDESETVTVHWEMNRARELMPRSTLYWRTDNLDAAADKPLRPGDIIRLEPPLKGANYTSYFMINPEGRASGGADLHVRLGGLTPAEATVAISNAFVPSYFTNWDYRVVLVRKRPETKSK